MRDTPPDVKKCGAARCQPGNRSRRRESCAQVVPFLLVVAIVADLAFAPAAVADTAKYILPPGNYGGVRFTPNSRDQLPLYDALTPLRGNVTMAESTRTSSTRTSCRSAPRTREHRPARAAAGLRLVRRAALTARRARTWPTGPAGARRATAPCWYARPRPRARGGRRRSRGINAFGLVTSGQPFVPSPQAEALITKQRKLLVKTYGAKGRQIIADAQAYADGINGYYKSTNQMQDLPPATVNDVIAVTASSARSSAPAAAGGQQLGPAREAPEGPRTGARPPRVGRRDAVRRPRGADHDQEALQLPAAHRRQGDRARWSSTRVRSRPSIRSPADGAAAVKVERRGRASADPRVELPGRVPRAARPRATRWP